MDLPEFPVTQLFVWAAIISVAIFLIIVITTYRASDLRIEDEVEDKEKFYKATNHPTHIAFWVMTICIALLVGRLYFTTGL